MDHLGAVPRRRVVGAGGLGITTLLLPSAAAATSPAGDGDGLTAPSITSATPSGYVGTSTGAVTLAWGSVPNATSYVVAWSTMSVNGPYSDGTRTTTATSIEVDGLAGTDTDHHFVVTAYRDGTPSAASSAVTASPVVASGGDVTTFEGDGTIGDLGTTYVVHTFTYSTDDDGEGRTEATLEVNDPRALAFLVVGGGGGGGGNRGRSFNCGGGGGGEVLAGSRSLESSVAGEQLAVRIGRGGVGGGADRNGVYAGIGTSSTFLHGTDGATTARGGGAGGSAPDYTEDPFADANVEAARPSGSTAGAATGGGGAGQAVIAQQGASGAGGLGSGGAGTAFIAVADVKFQRAGGGGGAAAGADGSPGSGTASGDGGAGVASNLSGVARAYGAGGGGGKRGANDGTTAAGLGGLTAGPAERVGGDGGRDGPGVAGDAGRGGGGGGGGHSGAGGDGGSGVVIVRYAL